MTDQNQGAGLQVEVGIARIFLKDFSFESPKSPQVFQTQVQPQLKVEVNVVPKNLGGHFFEVTLNLLIEASTSDGKPESKPQGDPVFIVEIEQAGIFEIKNANQQALDHILTVFAPTTLFPYARAMIDHAMIQGSFPALMLSPINFDAMRAQRLRGQAEQMPTGDVTVQ